MRVDGSLPVTQLAEWLSQRIVRSGLSSVTTHDGERSKARTMRAATSAGTPAGSTEHGPAVISRGNDARPKLIVPPNRGEILVDPTQHREVYAHSTQWGNPYATIRDAG